MENSRRPFDRSREPGTKKPRLTEELERGPNPGVRPFPQRQVASSGITTLASARFRVNDRELESGGYQPQPPPHQELVAQYKTALAELTFNSKPIITNLTIIAGENQYAAKAIAATVCANILEVPTEQKLPSLYLLDSIVKNIGRDYIKYFAARLPEVFCKAYRQVDPSVHTSMRHLFGTWRGVFPPQTLQMIEKELDFTPAVNGSASASAALRSDSQSQRPPHSIHVNPKYLERQRLQQSSRPKGVVDDMTVATANSTEDPERPDRALGAAQPWMDPSVSMRLRENNQRTHRDAFNDSVPGKSIDASYGSSEYGSDLSRNLGLGIARTGGRVTELGHDKTWYKAGSGVAETISGKRNGFSLKHGFSNNEVPKSMNLDVHHQTTQSLTGVRSSVMSSSWKNSEEEEFMWDEMNSGLTGHDAPNVSNKLSNDPWTADNENLEVEDQIQIRHPFGEKVDREISTESLSTEKKQIPAFGHHPSLSRQLQEQHSIDKLNQRPGHSDGFASNFGGLAANTNSSATSMGNRPFLPNATVGFVGMAGQQQFHSVGVESPSGISPLHQQSPSRNQYMKDSSSALPPNVQVGNLRRPQQKDLQGPFSSVTSFQQRHQQQLGSSHTEVTVRTEQPPLSKVSLAGEMSEHPSSLSGAAVKSGIFSNNKIISSLPTTSSLDTRNFPSQLGVRPARSGGPSPAMLISSLSAIASPSSLGPLNEDSSTLPKIPEGKDGQPPQAYTLQPASSNMSSASTQTSSAANNTLNPIANLLSSLVAKGLISAETESPTKVPAGVLTQLDDQSESITTSSSLPAASVSGSATASVPSTRDKVDDALVDGAAKTSLAVSQSTSTEIKNFIGFEFKPDVIRELHPPVIRGLSDDFPHLCSICGLRLKLQEQFNRHLEWHATREREQNSLTRASRRWYAKSSDWIVGKAEYPSEYELNDSVDAYGKKTEMSQGDAMVLADENQCLCVLCGELFEDVYCLERNEWMFKGAVYMTNSDSDIEMGIKNVSTARGPIIHERCLSENMISSVLKTEQD